MSKVKVDTLEDTAGTENVGITYVVNGSAKMLAFVDGSGTPSFNSSLNCSTLTDNGTGDYTINFTNDFADQLYHWSGGMSQDVGVANYLPPSLHDNATLVGSARYNFYNGAFATVDGITQYSSIHGDLA